ncbi:MAG TPA: Na+ dependent nucleoside transporter N-terminal domain-containing protein, partial [Erythrobacter sp.]|nr:Na+ dependent nucleoside transporter N-terminal domain-containing protein [Erythrobacter sp.]
MPQFLISLAGIAAILAIAFLLSNGKKRIKPRVVIAAFALQTAMALLVLRTPWGVTAIEGLSNGVIALLSYSKIGIEAVFGPMG